MYETYDSSNSLPCYLPDSHQSQDAVYWRTGGHVHTKFERSYFYTVVLIDRITGYVRVPVRPSFSYCLL